MVYFGPSRGCLTCKRRRKKCDEGRPSCLRCIKAQRTCGGYENGVDRLFRQYKVPDGNSAPFVSSARKCTLPMRVREPGTDMLPLDLPPAEVSDEVIEQFALRSFFYDYCIVSANRSLSRGYLDGLEEMATRLGFQSDLSKACKLVAFANHGTILNRPALTRTSEVLYQESLASLAKALANLDKANIAESLMVAMLLGLYEAIKADANSPGNHIAHAKGLAALLQIPDAPLDLLLAARSFRPEHPFFLSGKKKKSGMFPSASSSIAAESLDDLLLGFGAIWQQAKTSLVKPVCAANEIHELRSRASALDQAFVKWQESQSEDFRPWVVGDLQKQEASSLPKVALWPGRVDTYFDLYVASAWNTLRAIRLLLIDLDLKLSKRLINSSSTKEFDRNKAIPIVEDIMSSIPFHLAEDIQVFMRDAGKVQETAIATPGKAAGGLLLMYPLCAVSRLPIVPENMRKYMKNCLEWIDLNMGIGQAAVFAKSPEISEDYFVHGCMILWAGMLV